MKVSVIGVGMGNVDTLTVGALRAIESSDLLVGAQRLLDAFPLLPCKKRALVRADDIVRAVEDAADAGISCVSILMSGDVGFYSGATALYDRLAAYDVEVMPGVSSLAYFCAKLHMPWHDAAIVSAHGRDCDVVGAVQSHAKTFCIAGGATKVQDLFRALVEQGMGHLEAWVGENLSYDDECIVHGTVAELAHVVCSDLAVMLVLNNAPLQRGFGAPSLPDAAFERDAVPMTKEEVRALAIAKLRIAADHIVWDVGAGTGSVSIEAARAAFQGRVYAVERDETALSLLGRNREKLGASNVVIVAGEAPHALESLPAPDRVFIGGSAGNLAGIIDAARNANPAVRICLTAVTLETLAAATSLLQDRNIEDADIVQVSIARAQAVGSSHLMRAQNPVHIISFGGAGERISR